MKLSEMAMSASKDFTAADKSGTRPDDHTMLAPEENKNAFQQDA